MTPAASYVWDGSSIVVSWDARLPTLIFMTCTTTISLGRRVRCGGVRLRSARSWRPTWRARASRMLIRMVTATIIGLSRVTVRGVLRSTPATPRPLLGLRRSHPRPAMCGMGRALLCRGTRLPTLIFMTCTTTISLGRRVRCGGVRLRSARSWRPTWRARASRMLIRMVTATIIGLSRVTVRGVLRSTRQQPRDHCWDSAAHTRGQLCVGWVEHCCVVGRGCRR